jgi:hypothetical protein
MFQAYTTLLNLVKGHCIIIPGLKNSAALRHGKRTPPRQGLAEGFAFQKFHGDVGRAVIGLPRFVNGNHVGMMNTPRGSRLILKPQQKVGVIEGSG